MKFIDEVTIHCQSGKGGAGIVHFRREKYVPRGGPDGGDGGAGGDVVLVVDPNINTLLHLRYHPHQRAENGRPGGAQTANGRSGRSVRVPVPPGTLVWDEDGELLADLCDPDSEYVAAQGGLGGRGNARFASSTNRSPDYAQPGTEGVDCTLRLELRLLADVALLGYPNAGKSTFVAAVSAARPRIADYPFTTLAPNLGVVRGPDWRTLVVADIPGLIEGAASGRGLGNQFLRHVERCRVLCHLVSVSPAETEPEEDRYEKLRRELALRAEAEGSDLDSRSEVVALSQCDTRPPEEIQALVASFQERFDVTPLVLSAATGLGTEALKHALFARCEAVAPGPEPH